MQSPISPDDPKIVLGLVDCILKRLVPSVTEYRTIFRFMVENEMATTIVSNLKVKFQITLWRWGWFDKPFGQPS